MHKRNKRQIKQQLSLQVDDLEWLYVPDVEYVRYGECKRYLQLIIPYRSTWEREEKFPLILFIPGSAWYKQEMYNGIPACAKLAQRGFVVAVLQYRESEIAPFPAQVQDTRAALRFLRERVSDFHIDGERFYLAGNSSGGHIALLTGLTQGSGDFDIDLYREQDAKIRIKGIIACSAPTDITKSTGRPVLDLLGIREPGENPELAGAASCAKYIDREADIPPIMLIHGTDDDTVSIENGRSLFRLLEEAEKDVEYYEILGGGHGGALYWSDEVLDLLEGFIKKDFTF